MVYRVSATVLAVLALICFLGQATVAKAQGDKKAKTHEGKVVKAGDGKLTMTGKDGKNEHTHKVSSKAKITCDGKDCKLSDLKAGYKVTVTYEDDADKTATKIEAKST